MAAIGPVALAMILGAAAPRPAGAVEVAAFDFRIRPDRDFVRPDDWIRVIRPGYPDYVEAVLTTVTSAVAGRSLTFRMNGGNCAYFSPPINASAEFNYIVQGQIKTQGLLQDRALLLLEFLDARQQLVGVQHVSEEVGGTTGWTVLEIGPVAPASNDVRFLRIACLSRAGERPDLKGAVFFDDLWIGRLPRFEVATSGEYRIFDASLAKTVSLRVTGVEHDRFEARLQLADEEQRPLAAHTQPLVRQPDGVWSAAWEMPIADVGYFHLRIGLHDGDRKVLEGDYPITVLTAPPGRARGEFGLSSPVPPFRLAHLERLLTYSGARWIKIPLWADAERHPELGGRGREFAFFVERIEQKGHGVIGSLDEPPLAVQQNLTREMIGIADAFTLPKDKWATALEGVMARYGLKVTQWQVGGDHDASIADLPADQRAAVLETLKAEMDLYGRDVELGLPWNWLVAPAPVPGAAFLSLTEEVAVEGANGRADPQMPPLSAEALEAYLRFFKAPVGSDTQAKAGPKVWVQLAPLPADRYSRLDRLADWSGRILAAKLAGADRILAVRIADPQRGLMGPDGAPTELYTVWRTLAEHLADAEHIGELLLREPIQNRVFARDGRGIVVCWSDSPTEATLVVGAGTTVVDLWGRRRPLEPDAIAQKVRVGRLPILIAGANEELLRLQLSTRFQKGRLTSEAGRHHDELLFTNPFRQTMSGRVRLRFPESWNARPDQLPLQVRAEDPFAGQITFDIDQGSPQGEILVPIEFDVNTDRGYRFTVHRPFRLGGDEIKVATQTRLLADGRLEVELSVGNVSERPITIKCLLRAYQRPVARTDVGDLEPQATAVRRLYLDNGAELRGRTLLLQLFEVGGRRQFTIQVPVEK